MVVFVADALGFFGAWDCGPRDRALSAPRHCFRCLANPQSTCRAERNPGPRKPQNRNVQIRNLAVLDSKSPKLPRRSLATSQELLSLWILEALQGFPRSSPDVPHMLPRLSPELMGSLWRLTLFPGNLDNLSWLTLTPKLLQNEFPGSIFVCRMPLHNLSLIPQEIFCVIGWQWQDLIKHRNAHYIAQINFPENMFVYM